MMRQGWLACSGVNSTPVRYWKLVAARLGRFIPASFLSVHERSFVPRSSRNFQPTARGLQDEAHAHPEARKHVDQRVRAEQVDATPQQIAHAGLRNAKYPCDLHLRHVSGVDRLLQVDEQIGADEEVLGFFSREPEIAKDVAARRGDLQLIFSWHRQLAFRSPTRDTVRARPSTRALASYGSVSRSVHHIDRFRERGDVEYAVLEPGVNPDLSNPGPHAGHRLPVIGIEALLDPSELKPGAPPRHGRKRAEVAPGASEPHDWLITHGRLCKLLYIVSTRPDATPER
jgi:hypothetical protein